jgi:hypothetical protein
MRGGGAAVLSHGRSGGLWVFALALVFVGCASYEKVANQDTEISKVCDIDLSKDEIYDGSLQFIAENFTSAKAVLEYQDRNAGRIIGNGSAKISDGVMDRPATFTMIVDIKDNRYRVSFRTFQYQPGEKLPWGPIEYKTPYENMAAQMNSLADRLYAYLSKSRDNQDF